MIGEEAGNQEKAFWSRKKLKNIIFVGKYPITIEGLIFVTLEGGTNY